MAYKKKANKSKETPFERDKRYKKELGERMIDFITSSNDAFNPEELDIGFNKRKGRFTKPKKYSYKEGDTEFYSGINLLNLSVVAEELGLVVNKWISFKNAEGLIIENLENLPEGSNAKQILKDVHKESVYRAVPVYWEAPEGSDKKLPIYNGKRYTEIRKMSDKQRSEEGIETTSVIAYSGKALPMEHLRPFIDAKHFDNDPDFNIDSVKMSEELENAYITQRTDNLIASLGLPVYERESNSAYYSPSKHHIVLPLPEQFYNPESRFSIASHEGGHSKAKQFGVEFLPSTHKDYEKSYSKEEVVAEGTAMIVCAHYGIQSFSQHCKYMGGWAKNYCGDNPEELYKCFKESEKRANVIINDLEAYELKQKLELEQKLPNALEATDLRISGDTVYQTYRSANEPDKSFIVEVDLKDLDKDTFINEKHLTDFAKNHCGSKSISEYSAALKSDLKEHTVLSFETNRVVLQAQEQERIKAKAEQKQDVSQQVEQKQTKRAKLSA
ncbi:zincin-like metallopeptidase domain-containing protein [Vibrio parahaemolyticus]|uniref:zincin-like metallopeptidase domain-containing protein n=1 Tax=Vibrio parahaemolyticus TaxID=670 RepID=UPI000C27CBBF|nr:zincin-like metallopeptidase domain-containing protein [Vibrio parahaemolyticus]PJN44103.1 hypothetical protein CNR26_20220 [Vibrio parahaemolyticus]